MLRTPVFFGSFLLASVALVAVAPDLHAQPITSLDDPTAPLGNADGAATAREGIAPTAGAAPYADRPAAQPKPPESKDPFDRHLAVGGYGVAWAGAYPAAGVGGRIRYEWPHKFGMEGFADHLAVQWPGGGIRHDHPIGFNIYMPFQISRSVRLRPLFGACAVFSFIEPEHSGGPRADDIMFGVHGGLGMEVALEQNWSFFMEGQGIAYLAHDRTSHGWTGSVSQSMTSAYVFQPNMGLAVHFL